MKYYLFCIRISSVVSRQKFKTVLCTFNSLKGKEKIDKKCAISRCFNIPRVGQEGAKSAGEASPSKALLRSPHCVNIWSVVVQKPF